MIEEQKGIVRVNCIDCLDRTNVSQSFLAQKSFDSQLQRIGLFSTSECMLQHSNIHREFKILWANHGDEDAMDLVAGHYTVSRGNPSPFHLNGFESLAYLPVASVLIVGGLTIQVLLNGWRTWCHIAWKETRIAQMPSSPPVLSVTTNHRSLYRCLSRKRGWITCPCRHTPWIFPPRPNLESVWGIHRGINKPNARAPNEHPWYFCDGRNHGCLT